ncbi:MAG: hypothetical protein JWM80_3446 [Cyanobacteria bacterium RYN_339]|nr:hypothetical protein [Cyanobacteria bacterium RYN_339]
MRSLPFALGLIVAACQPAPAPTEVAAVAVASAAPGPVAKIHVTAPQAGAVTITGDVGAIEAAGAARVLIGIVHDLLGSYVLLHVGSTVVVGGAKVPITPGGGFDPVTIGTAGGPAQAGDRVLVVPKDAADTACGETTYLLVP